MIRSQWPTPAQIGTYLTTHGWHFDRPMKQPGAVYSFEPPSADGDEIELFVPEFKPHVDAVEDFASSVLAVVDTVQALEHRSREAILAEMLATEVSPAVPRQPVT